MTAIVGKVVFVKYVGLKDKKVDNVGKTGLTWTKGQIHAVPAALAAPLLQHPLIWMPAAEADFQDPSNFGQCTDETALVVEETEEQRAAREEEEEAVMAELPNLAPLNKTSIAQFAKRTFGLDLDVAALKKDDMLKIVRDTANSRAAIGKLDMPGTIQTPAAEVTTPEIIASGTATFGAEEPVVIEGHVDPAELANAAISRGEMPQLVPSAPAAEEPAAAAETAEAPADKPAEA